MFGHSDDRSERNKQQPDNGTLTSDDNKGLGALVGDMSTSYPPSDLRLPTTAPTPPSAPSQGMSNDAGIITSVPEPAAVLQPAAHPDELLDIKQQALQHLSPLVDHLEQSPSDRFRTTMMMIQASDNASLIKAAYDAALAITDDKERAQALLDLINEINYFTQNQSSNAAKQV
jgi:hypothetical protein